MFLRNSFNATTNPASLETQSFGISIGESEVLEAKYDGLPRCDKLDGSSLRIVSAYTEAGYFCEVNCVTITDGERTAVYVPAMPEQQNFRKCKMSLSRLYRICHKILPFNYGMDASQWITTYNNLETRFLCPEDPSLWDAETIAEVDAKAEAENQLAARLMSLSDEEFRAEVDRLELFFDDSPKVSLQQIGVPNEFV